MNGTETKKKCLLILPRSIFPVIGGYAIKNKALIEILSKKFDLFIVVISDHTPEADEKEFYESNSIEYQVFVFPKYRYLLNAVKSLFSKEPLQVGYFYFKEVQQYINKILPNCDICVGALIRAMKYLKNSRCEVKVFDMVDSIALNYQRSYSNVKSLFWKAIYKIEMKRLFKFEEYWIKKSDITYLFNWKETEYWEKFGNVHLVPHGVNDKLFAYEKVDDRYNNGVAFMGKMDYQPNIDAVLWYLKNVHSKIGNTVPFYIVGANPTKTVIDEAEKYTNVQVTGFVDDPFIYVKSAMAVVAPMQTGGGIQNKVLEAMGLGKTVITTTLSAFPIYNAQNGKHLIIADTPEDFIKEILEIKNNTAKADAIGLQARKFIEDHYTWKAYGEKYVGEIQKLLNN